MSEFDEAKHEAEVRAWKEWLQRDPASAMAAIQRMHAEAYEKTRGLDTPAERV